MEEAIAEGDGMVDQKDQNEFMSYEEALLSQVFTLDALVNVLEKKGVISREEVVEEIVRLQEQRPVSES